MSEFEKVRVKEVSEDILKTLRVFEFFCKLTGLQKVKIYNTNIIPMGKIYKIYSCFVAMILYFGMIYIIIAMCLLAKFDSPILKSTIAITHIWIFINYVQISISAIFFLPKNFMKILYQISIADSIISMHYSEPNVFIRNRAVGLFSIHVIQKLLQIIMDLFLWMTNLVYFVYHIVMVIIDFELMNFVLLVSTVNRRIERLNFLMINSVEAKNSKSCFKIKQGSLVKSWRLKYKSSEIKSNPDFQGFIEIYKSIATAINIIQDSYGIHVCLLLNCI